MAARLWFPEGRKSVIISMGAQVFRIVGALAHLPGPYKSEPAFRLSPIVRSLVANMLLRFVFRSVCFAISLDYRMSQHHIFYSFMSSNLRIIGSAAPDVLRFSARRRSIQACTQELVSQGFLLFAVLHV